MLRVVLNPIEKVVEIESDSSEINLRSLYSRIQEELTLRIQIPMMVEAAGLEKLSSGVIIPITVVMLDDWHLRMKDDGVKQKYTINGGNLTGRTNRQFYNPIIQTTDKTLVVEQEQIKPSKDIIDWRRDRNFLYWVSTIIFGVFAIVFVLLKN